MKKVVKFGGSSLASAEQFKKVADIIRSDSDRRYVIPSAPGKRFYGDTKVTDMLYNAHATQVDGDDVEPIVRSIKARYDDIIKGLDVDISLNDEFDKIIKNIQEGCNSDYVASRGEYLNGIILAYYLGFEFIDAADVIFFDANGRLDSKKTYATMSEVLSRNSSAVIPGFYGSAIDGSIKTFSRGGSDITGSIVSKAVRADAYENWTDVSGFMIADPGIIDNPERIEIITYKELRELAYMGATVLHEESIFPVRNEGIPINIRNTNNPEDEGTWIVESTCKKSEYIITGIAGKKGFCAVNIEKAMMNSEIGFGRKVLNIFEENGISFEHVPSGIDTMTVFVHQDEFVDKEQQVVAGLHRYARPDSVDIEGDLALIAVVGRGMKSTRGTAGRIFSALAHANVNVKMIDQGSSELNIIIGVKDEDFAKAIEAIYNIFVVIRL